MSQPPTLMTPTPQNTSACALRLVDLTVTGDGVEDCSLLAWPPAVDLDALKESTSGSLALSKNIGDTVLTTSSGHAIDYKKTQILSQQRSYFLIYNPASNSYTLMRLPSRTEVLNVCKQRTLARSKTTLSAKRPRQATPRKSQPPGEKTLTDFALEPRSSESPSKKAEKHASTGNPVISASAIPTASSLLTSKRPPPGALRARPKSGAVSKDHMAASSCSSSVSPSPPAATLNYDRKQQVFDFKKTVTNFKPQKEEPIPRFENPEPDPKFKNAIQRERKETDIVRHNEEKKLEFMHSEIEFTPNLQSNITESTPFQSQDHLEPSDTKDADDQESDFLFRDLMNSLSEAEAEGDENEAKEDLETLGQPISLSAKLAAEDSDDESSCFSGTEDF